jgi:hypothetical protein
MHAVRKCDKDGIDISFTQTFLIFIVGIGIGNPIPPAQALQLFRVVGHECGQVRIGSGMRKGRQDCDLRDMAEPHHSIADLRPVSMRVVTAYD